MIQQDALTIERIEIGTLSLDPANVRKHGERNREAIIGSLKRFGQQKPIVVNTKGVVVAGNGTLDAAKALGWTHIDIVRTDLDGSEATAFAIADNRTAELAEWDDETLAAQLDALRHDDLDAALAAGFSEAEIDKLLADTAPPVEIDEDDVPEPPAEPVTQPGDVWTLGRHRLVCGDSTDAASVARLWGDDRAAAVLTDPPYGVNYVGGTLERERIANDGPGDLKPLLSAAFDNASAICIDGGVWYVAAPPGPQFAVFAAELSRLGIWRQTIAWLKDSLVFGRSDYHYKHEAIFYGWKPGAAHHAPPDRTQTSVWEFGRPKRSDEHPTMKPVALYAKMLDMSTAVGALVYEPFGGSGTTLIACEQLGRSCRCIEISPAYCDVIVERWQNMTGEKATREPSA